VSVLDRLSKKAFDAVACSADVDRRYMSSDEPVDLLDLLLEVGGDGLGPL
jgi:hypothetical protein